MLSQRQSFPVPQAESAAPPAHTILLSICHHNISISSPHKNTDGTAVSFQQLSFQAGIPPAPGTNIIHSHATRNENEKSRAEPNDVHLQTPSPQLWCWLLLLSYPSSSVGTEPQGEHREQGTGSVPWCCQLCPVPVPGSPGRCSPSLLCTAPGQTGLRLLFLRAQNAASYTSNQVGRINLPLAMLSC